APGWPDRRDICERIEHQTTHRRRMAILTSRVDRGAPWNAVQVPRLLLRNPLEYRILAASALRGEWCRRTPDSAGCFTTTHRYVRPSKRAHRTAREVQPRVHQRPRVDQRERRRGGLPPTSDG